MTAGRDRRIARMRLSSRSSSPAPTRSGLSRRNYPPAGDTASRSNGRFTLHSCTQARQATLWVTIGFAERFSLAAEDDEDDKFALGRTRGRNAFRVARRGCDLLINRKRLPGVTFDSLALEKYYGLAPAARQSVVWSHDAASGPISSPFLSPPSSTPNVALPTRVLSH